MPITFEKIQTMNKYQLQLINERPIESYVFNVFDRELHFEGYGLHFWGKELIDGDIQFICQYLNQHPEITVLDLSFNPISDEDAILLAANKTLKVLKLPNNNNIGPEAVQALANNQTITSLDLSNNRIGDKEVLYLAQNKVLTELNVSGNPISEESINLLAETLERNVLEREKLDVIEKNQFSKNFRLKRFNQDFKEVINVLPQKMRQFQEHPDYKVNVKLQEAYNAASTLFQALEQEGNQFINKDPNLKDLEQFKLNCKEHIKNARTILDEHRGWAKILLNIFAMIMTAGIGYAVAAAINVAVKGRFTFFSTDSSEKLSNIEKHIETKETLGKQGYLK